MNENLEKIYRQVIMEHYKEPNNRVNELSEEKICHLDNPSCGDEIKLSLTIDNENVIKDVKYNNDGCSISMASASMFSEMIKGMHVKEAKILADNFNLMIDNKECDKTIDFGDLIALTGVSKFIARRKCAKIATSCFNKYLKEFNYDK